LHRKVSDALTIIRELIRNVDTATFTKKD